MKQVFILGMFWFASMNAAAFQLHYSDTLTITEPVYRNLYIAGGNVYINAPVHGDLIIAGGTIHINDTVTKDILLIGGKAIFNGYVGDDIRCAGANITVLKNVAGDVIILGGAMTIGKDARIGNLFSAGGNLTIDGTVTGELKGRAGNIVLNGTATKDVNCQAEKITINGKIQGPATLVASKEIEIGKNADFEFEARYWSPAGKIDFGRSTRPGLSIYDKSLKIDYDRWYFLGFASLLGLIWYAGMAVILILMLQYLFSSTMKKAGETAYLFTWRSLVYGVLFWIGVPVMAIISFITIIGVPIGLILIMIYIISAILASVVVSVVGANWLNNSSGSKWKFWKLVFAAFGIFVMLKIFTSTPFFGWIILSLLVCIAFGAIGTNINWRGKKSIAS
ncbi:MAG: polymer-forming cytoskeletal protein [Chitinophagales bacterium]